MLRASRTGVGSYEITCDDRPVCTWKPKVFLRAGTFVLDGRRYDVARGWIGHRYRLLDDAGGLVAEADGVGGLTWTLEISGETDGVRHTFQRPSLFRRDQMLVVDGAPAGTVRRTSVWRDEVEADLPGLPLLVQVFVLVSLLAVWAQRV
jgi:hypothetical protein